MGLKDLARALREKDCPAVPVPSTVPVGHHRRTDAHTISGTAGTTVPRGTYEAAGTTGTGGTLGTDGTGGTRRPAFETLPPSPEPDAFTLAEREALAADRCPPEYLAAWARFQLVRPRWALEGEWREAVDGAGRFLDQWGSMAAHFGWSPDELFGRDGLAWFLTGETVRGLGPIRATLNDGRNFERRLKSNAGD